MKPKNVHGGKPPRNACSKPASRCSPPVSALLESSPFFELMDSVRDFVLVLDPGLRIIMANCCLTVMLGYSERELVAKDLPELLDAGDRRRIVGLIHRAKQRMGGEASFLSRSRKKIHICFSVSPLADSGGRLQGYLLIGHLSGEKEIAQISDLPKGLATRIIHGLADPAFIVACPTRTVCDCNEAAISAFGFRRNEFVGRRLVDFLTTAKEYDQNDDLIRRIDDAYAKIGFINERFRFARKNGSSILCDCISVPFLLSDGSLAYKISIFSDRSREEQREAEFTEFVARVKRFSSEFEKFTPVPTNSRKAKPLSELGFTPRQIEISRLVTRGISSKEIGSQLGIAESTVKGHLSVIFRKLAVRSRLEFIRMLTEQRFIFS
jgi:PAS domain S-box-containing protein